jgi:hypothetical protein
MCDLKILKLYIILKRLVILTIIFTTISCYQNEMIVDIKNENKLILEDVLKTKNFECQQSKNIYQLSVIDSRLTTDFGKEMGASISALIVYEEVSNIKPMLVYNSFFEIKYLDNNHIFKYSLQEVSDAFRGQIMIDSLISSLKKKNEIDNTNKNTQILLDQNIDWTSVGSINFGGFSYFDENKDLVYFRVFFGVDITEIRIYFDTNKNEIFKIES